jgi:hypothetical protein
MYGMSTLLHIKYYIFLPKLAMAQYSIYMYCFCGFFWGGALIPWAFPAPPPPSLLSFHGLILLLVFRFLWPPRIPVFELKKCKRQNFDPTGFPHFFLHLLVRWLVLA